MSIIKIKHTFLDPEEIVRPATSTKTTKADCSGDRVERVQDDMVVEDKLR